jgi:hypothetical protein
MAAPAAVNTAEATAATEAAVTTAVGAAAPVAAEAAEVAVWIRGCQMPEGRQVLLLQCIGLLTAVGWCGPTPGWLVSL